MLVFKIWWVLRWGFLDGKCLFYLDSISRDNCFRLSLMESLASAFSTCFYFLRTGKWPMKSDRGVLTTCLKWVPQEVCQAIITWKRYRLASSQKCQQSLSKRYSTAVSFSRKRSQICIFLIIILLRQWKMVSTGFFDAGRWYEPDSHSSAIWREVKDMTASIRQRNGMTIKKVHFAFDMRKETCEQKICFVAGLLGAYVVSRGCHVLRCVICALIYRLSKTSVSRWSITSTQIHLALVWPRNLSFCIAFGSDEEKEKNNKSLTCPQVKPIISYGILTGSPIAIGRQRLIFSSSGGLLVSLNFMWELKVNLDRVSQLRLFVWPRLSVICW